MRRVIPRRRLSASAKALLGLEIAVAYAEARWRMTRSDIRTTVAEVRRASPGGRLPSRQLDEQQVAIRLGRAVDRTLRLLPTDARCLVQALVLTKLLAARSIDSTLVIGAHARPAFTAHAWVEHGGIPVQSPQTFSESRLLEI